MSNTGLSYSGRHSYASHYSYVRRQGAGSPDEEDPQLVQGLLASREELLAELGDAQRGCFDDLRTRPLWQAADNGELPYEKAASSGGYAPNVRAALIEFELLSLLEFDFDDKQLQGELKVRGKPTPLIAARRPRDARFVAELAQIDALAPLRASRQAEVLSQIPPPLPYFAMVMNLQAGRHERTVELLQAALQCAFTVGMRFKHCFGAARPTEHSSEILPMIEVPRHPSYPAGHAIEAHVSAHLLAAISGAPRDPAASTQYRLLRRLADRIAENRIVAGVHFPVDCAFGRLIGDALGGFLVAACDGTSAWRGASFAPSVQGAAFAPSERVFGDDATATEQGTVDARLPVLRELWRLARAEWA